MITEEQRQKLNEDLPPDAVAKRQGGGKQLSYVQGWWVIDRLNEIFGPGGWSYRCSVERVYDGTNEKGQYVCTYLGRCVLTVGDCVIEDVGAGQGDATKPGDAIEKAAKEAATDALKRCAKSLGRSMGLALYDKEQAHVGEAPAPATAPQSSQPPPKVGNEVSIILEMLATADRPKAQKLIRDGWQKFNQAEKDAINKAVAGKQKAA